MQEIKRKKKKPTFLWRFGKIVGGAVLGLFVYNATLIGLQIYSTSNSKPIRNQGHLGQLVIEEMKKLGIEDKNILIRSEWNSKRIGAYSLKIGEESYEIFINPSVHKVSHVKHELYHIADGHCDNKARNLFTYLFYEEPQATLYEAFGWEL